MAVIRQHSLEEMRRLGSAPERIERAWNDHSSRASLHESITLREAFQEVSPPPPQRDVSTRTGIPDAFFSDIITASTGEEFQTNIEHLVHRVVFELSRSKADNSLVKKIRSLLSKKLPEERVWLLPPTAAACESRKKGRYQLTADQGDNASMLAKQLEQLATLEVNWDGHGAPVPNDGAMKIAYEAVTISQEFSFPDARVTPDVEGGVAVYFFGGATIDDGGWSHQAGILIDNDGDMVLYLRDRSKDGSDISDVGTSTEEIRAALKSIYQFINGASDARKG